MIYQKLISKQTKGLYDFVEITRDIEQIVKESKIKMGVVFVNLLHNTAALLVQEADPSIHKDLQNLLNSLAPLDAKYFHDYEGNVNATAHLKSNLLGSTLSFGIKNSKLMLGTWQKAWLIELFESRKRNLLITVIGEG